MFSYTVKSCVLIGMLVSTTACSTPMEITEPAVSMNASAAFDQERVKGTTSLLVRSYAQKPDAKQASNRVEVGNANCLAKGPGFSARFQTPAELRVPVLKSRPEPMEIDCVASDLRGSQTVPAGLPNATVTGGGLVLGLATFIVTSAVSSAIDEWRYTGNQGIVPVNLLNPEDYAAYVQEKAKAAAETKAREAKNEARRALRSAEQDG